MGVGISYMGTKRELASSVSEVIAEARDGPLLDAFSGMCSVGEAVGTSRQVWTNDSQRFSADVGAALFTSADEPLNPVSAADLHHDLFSAHQERLQQDFSRSIGAEDKLLASTAFEGIPALSAEIDCALAIESSRTIGRSLFTRLYGNSYFGVRQAVEIDSIASAIESAFESGVTSADHRRWSLIALGRSMLRVSNSPGHFAQFLKPKPGSYRVFLRQRKRSLWREWLLSLDDLQPVGTMDWRLLNKSFNEDSLTLIPRLTTSSYKPAVVYADPPYTDDQYSRYYHLLETLLYYDEPELSGAGRYRKDRFRTPFSLKTRAPEALEQLVSGIASLGADVVLSYPTNGLLYGAATDPEMVLRRYFPRVERRHALTHEHSTFGASKGEAKSAVTEQIFLGRL